MLVVNRAFVENDQTPKIVADHEGKIIFRNSSTDYLMEKTGMQQFESITDLNPAINLDSIEDNTPLKTSIHIKKLEHKVCVYRIRYEDRENCYLMQINNLFTVDDYDAIFDKIVSGIVVVNGKSQIELMNKAQVDIIYNKRQTRLGEGAEYLGEKISELVDQNIVKKSSSMEVLRLKKPVNMIVTYFNGQTAMLSSSPLFDKKGNITRIISTSRDVTELNKLEKKLRKAENQKKEYLSKLKELSDAYDISNVIYHSKKMKDVISMCAKIVTTDSSVFINGETGVGKEIIARFIHDNGNRSDKPFVPINCSAIPESLFESELFGYEEGAFSGAKKEGKRGLFEEANGGVIFLDEVSELPYNMQSKLLRVIQEKKLSRIGSNQSISINVRFISASNLDPEQLFDNKEFRQDLYYRLATIPVNIPPLRERKEDIKPLTAYFLNRFCEKYNRMVKLHKDLVNSMNQYEWPGNIRELRNFVERIVILSDNDVIMQDDFNLFKNTPIDLGNSQNIPFESFREMPLADAIRKLENTMIKWAYQECRNVCKAADRLQIAPSTIYRKVKKGKIKLNP